MNKTKRVPAHQRAVLEMRRSSKATWDRRPKGQRTRADQDRQARKAELD